VLDAARLDEPDIAPLTDGITRQHLNGPSVYRQWDIIMRLQGGVEAIVVVDSATECVEVQVIEGVIEICLEEVSLALPAEGVLKLSRAFATASMVLQLMQGTATLCVAHVSALLSSGTTLEAKYVPELEAAALRVVMGPPVPVTAYGITAVVPPGSGTLMVLSAPPTFYLDHRRLYGEADVWLESTTVLEVQADSSCVTQLKEVMRDIVLLGLAYYGAYLLRWDGNLPSQELAAWMRTLPLIIIMQMVCFLAYGAYRSMWRYVGIDDLLVIAKSVFAGTLLSALSTAMLYGSPRPSLALFAQFMMLGIMFVGGARVMCRSFRDRPYSHAQSVVPSTPSMS
jgi:hypothetical protein